LRVITRVALTLACVGALALPSTAHAASYDSRCDFGEVCLFRDTGLRGGVVFDLYAEGGCWTRRLGFIGSLPSSYYIKARSKGRFSNSTSTLYTGAWHSGNLGYGLDNNVEYVSNCHNWF
jgi:hypothetical protein